jgi:hypothetical protein
MSQKGPENVEKSHKFGLKRVFQKKIVLANLKYISSYNMMKKNWCQYITLGLIFSHLLKLRHHLRIY